MMRLFVMPMLPMLLTFPGRIDGNIGDERGLKISSIRASSLTDSILS